MIFRKLKFKTTLFEKKKKTTILYKGKKVIRKI